VSAARPHGGETGPPPARRRLIIHGRVQGVYFRDTLRGRAENRGVKGWVTNRADGTVEAALEGRRADVEALIGFCRQGPARAEVERVEIREEEPEGLTDFKIE
jgi:acylphosphatase